MSIILNNAGADDPGVPKSVWADDSQKTVGDDAPGVPKSVWADDSQKM